MPTAWANNSAVRIHSIISHLSLSIIILPPICNLLVAEFVNDKRLSHVPGPNNYD